MREILYHLPKIVLLTLTLCLNTSEGQTSASPPPEPELTCPAIGEWSEIQSTNLLPATEVNYYISGVNQAYEQSAYGMPPSYQGGVTPGGGYTLYVGDFAITTTTSTGPVTSPLANSIVAEVLPDRLVLYEGGQQTTAAEISSPEYIDNLGTPDGVDSKARADLVKLATSAHRVGSSQISRNNPGGRWFWVNQFPGKLIRVSGNTLEIYSKYTRNILTKIGNRYFRTASIDSYGNRINYTYNNQTLVAEEHPFNILVTYDSTTPGIIIKSTARCLEDNYGKCEVFERIKYAFNANSQLTSVSYPGPAYRGEPSPGAVPEVDKLNSGYFTLSFRYDSNKLVEITKSRGEESLSLLSFKYDASGKLSQTTNVFGNHTTYSYSGQQLTIRTDRGVEITTLFDANDRIVERVVRPNSPFLPTYTKANYTYADNSACSIMVASVRFDRGDGQVTESKNYWDTNLFLLRGTEKQGPAGTSLVSLYEEHNPWIDGGAATRFVEPNSTSTHDYVFINSPDPTDIRRIAVARTKNYSVTGLDGSVEAYSAEERVSAQGLLEWKRSGNVITQTVFDRNGLPIKKLVGPNNGSDQVDRSYGASYAEEQRNDPVTGDLVYAKRGGSASGPVEFRYSWDNGYLKSREVVGVSKAEYFWNVWGLPASKREWAFDPSGVLYAKGFYDIHYVRDGQYNLLVEREIGDGADPRGAAVEPIVNEYRYNSFGEMTEEKPWFGHAREFSFHPTGELYQIKLKSGLVLEEHTEGAAESRARFLRGSSGGSPVYETVTVAYNEFNYPISRTSSLGAKENFGYDSYGYLHTVRSSINGVDSFESKRSRDEWGRVTAAYVRDIQKSVTLELSKFYYKGLDLLGVDDLRDGKSSFSYGRMGELEGMSEASGAGAQYRYAEGLLSKITILGSERIEGDLFYDRGERLSEIKLNTGGNQQRELYKYDSLGGVEVTSYDDRIFRHIFDGLGRYRMGHAPNGARVEFGYEVLPSGKYQIRKSVEGESSIVGVFGDDGTESVVNGDGRSTTVFYDGVGVPSRFRYQDGTEKSWQIDPKLRLTSASTTLSTGAKIDGFSFSYDPQNLLKKVIRTPGDRTLGYEVVERGVLGQILKESILERGRAPVETTYRRNVNNPYVLEGYSINNARVDYAVNLDSRLVKALSFVGGTKYTTSAPLVIGVKSFRDAHSGFSYPVGSSSIEVDWTVDGAGSDSFIATKNNSVLVGKSIDYNEDGGDAVHKIVNGIGTLRSEFAYNRNNNSLASISQSLTSLQGQTSTGSTVFSYDSGNPHQLSSATTPDGKVHNYVYRSDGAPTKVGDYTLGYDSDLRLTTMSKSGESYGIGYFAKTNLPESITKNGAPHCRFKYDINNSLITYTNPSGKEENYYSRGTKKFGLMDPKTGLFTRFFLGLPSREDPNSVVASLDLTSRGKDFYVIGDSSAAYAAYDVSGNLAESFVTSFGSGVREVYDSAGRRKGSSETGLRSGLHKMETFLECLPGGLAVTPNRALLLGYHIWTAPEPLEESFLYFPDVTSRTFGLYPQVLPTDAQKFTFALNNRIDFRDITGLNPTGAGGGGRRSKWGKLGEFFANLFGSGDTPKTPTAPNRQSGPSGGGSGGGSGGPEVPDPTKPGETDPDKIDTRLSGPPNKQECCVVPKDLPRSIINWPKKRLPEAPNRMFNKALWNSERTDVVNRYMVNLNVKGATMVDHGIGVSREMDRTTGKRSEKLRPWAKFKSPDGEEFTVYSSTGTCTPGIKQPHEWFIVTGTPEGEGWIGKTHYSVYKSKDENGRKAMLADLMKNDHDSYKDLTDFLEIVGEPGFEFPEFIAEFTRGFEYRGSWVTPVND